VEKDNLVAIKEWLAARPPTPADKVYFGVLIDPARAEFLKRALDFPLCKHCAREEAECIADPCARALYDRDGYIAARGLFCPKCGSARIDGHSVDTFGGAAEQEVTCNDCDASWYDHYKLVDYSLIEESKE